MPKISVTFGQSRTEEGGARGSVPQGENFKGVPKNRLIINQ